MDKFDKLIFNNKIAGIIFQLDDIINRLPEEDINTDKAVAKSVTKLINAISILKEIKL